MTDPSLNITLARPSFSYVATAGEALDIVSSVQFLVADSIRSSLESQLSSGDELIQKILGVSDLLRRVKESMSGPFNPVTVEKLMNSPRTAEDLSKLFLNDGPRLGNSIAEGQTILDDLLGLGANVEVKILYPLLTEVKDSDERLTSSQFQWLTQAQLNNILDAQFIPFGSDFPGSVSFSKKSDSSVTTYTIFESYGIMRPEVQMISNAFSKIGDVVDNYRNQLAGLIANTSRAASQLESMVERVSEHGKKLELKQTENYEKDKSDLTDILRKIYILKIEKFIKDELKVDPEVAKKISGRNELQSFLEIYINKSENFAFKTDAIISTQAPENSANPDE